MIFQILLYLLLFISPNSYTYEPTPAVCIVPVADLLTLPMATYQLNNNIEQAYKELPLSWVHDKKACPRDHQLLFNEVVTIIDENEDEYHLEISQSFYETAVEHFAHYTYWTLKSNILKLSDLDPSALLAIPEPISCIENNIDQANANVVTLKYPYYDPITHRTYSAGTRFNASKLKSHKNMFLSIFDATNKEIRNIKIPKSHCACNGDQVDNQQYKTPTEKIADFVALLREWANMPNKFIPVVWGGCSFIDTYDNEAVFSQVAKIGAAGQSIDYWIHSQVPRSIKTGFDASALILRAAQICDMPFYCKNTLTAMRNLEKLGHADALSEGDLIWIPGGLAIVSSLKENKIITLLGYWSGYGKIFETTLDTFLTNISSFDQLVHAYHTHQKLELHAINGQTREIEELKLLKISSIWK